MKTPPRITVISQNPPGGRCTLYAGYARQISARLDIEMNVRFSDCRDAHGNGFPSLLVGEVAVQPADGVILAPEDLVAALEAAGIGADPGLGAALEAELEKMLAGAG
jgi:cystathionine gamma-synthase